MLGGYDYLDYVGVDLQTDRSAPFSEIIGAIFSPLCHPSLSSTRPPVLFHQFSAMYHSEDTSKEDLQVLKMDGKKKKKKAVHTGTDQ
ncbi:hypothetical protein MtrunA17_Chr3g0119781 [Medicago truncatula]|uniref:Uncharacterized protein n=1 Tax=Medicago truncatula TaxID=3880 RepID=A0A396IX72_MEDTR|nr:hypothetical protein MtrunA17_Chr3g0119781 [Medicago truncatula]